MEIEHFVLGLLDELNKDLIKSEALFFVGWVLFLFVIKFYMNTKKFNLDSQLRNKKIMFKTNLTI